MARIRTIKPEFWDDEKISKLSHTSRLLFIGMWNFAEDNGVIRANETWLKSKIFPYEPSLKIHGGLSELSQQGLILNFKHEDQEYFYIRHFKDHQKINRPTPPKYCNISDELINSLITHGGLSEDSRKISSGSGSGSGSGKDIYIVGLTPLFDFLTEKIWNEYRADKILSYLNQVTGKNLDLIDSNRKPIIARLKESNYSFDDFTAVIDRKFKDEFFRNKFMTPQTLFGNKFNTYVNEVD